MGIMIPVLGTVRRYAKNMLSMNNQHEMVMGLGFYAEDNDGKYPPSVAVVGKDDKWNWSDPRKMTAFYGTTIGGHRAMSEYLRGYIEDASIMYCPNAPKRYKYLQAAWDAGDDWDNPDTLLLEDAVKGTYCFWWNYAGIVDGRVYRGPRNTAGGRKESKVLVSCYFGFGHWRNQKLYGDGNYNAYGSCERFKGANITPGGDMIYPAGAAYWSRLGSGDGEGKPVVRLRAGYIDGHVGSYGSGEVDRMKVIKNRKTNEVYSLNGMGPGHLYVPKKGL